MSLFVAKVSYPGPKRYYVYVQNAVLFCSIARRLWSEIERIRAGIIHLVYSSIYIFIPGNSAAAVHIIILM